MHYRIHQYAYKPGVVNPCHLMGFPHQRNDRVQVFGLQNTWHHYLENKLH